MALIRGKHSFDGHFTQIPNAWLRDNKLSFRARGLLAQILSNATGFQLSISGLASQNREGKDAIRAAVGELEQFGYLKRSQQNDGRFGEAVWETCDPMAENPMAENPTTENPTPKKNKDKEDQIKKNNNASALFDDFWNEYPRKRDRGAALRAFKSALNRAKFEEIMAGLIRYKHDSTRKPEFTKYPATWLNADGWENDYDAPANSEAKRLAEIKREKERQATQEMLRELKEQQSKAGLAPVCQHGTNPALCRLCLKDVN
jgi:hypothetical protein